MNDKVNMKIKNLIFVLMALFLVSCGGNESEYIDKIQLGGEIRDAYFAQKEGDLYKVQNVNFFDEALLKVDQNGKVGVILFQKNYIADMDNIESILKGLKTDVSDFERALIEKWDGDVFLNGGMSLSENVGLAIRSLGLPKTTNLETEPLFNAGEILEQGVVSILNIKSKVVDSIRLNTSSGIARKTEGQTYDNNELSINFNVMYIGSAYSNELSKLDKSESLKKTSGF